MTSDALSSNGLFDLQDVPRSALKHARGVRLAFGFGRWFRWSKSATIDTFSNKCKLLRHRLLPTLKALC